MRLELSPRFDAAAFADRVRIYKDLLTRFNAVHNLTNFKDIEANINDSVGILNFADFSGAGRIVDVGSGAGFPAIFLAFLLKSEFYLFEPNPKKAAFLRMVKIECALKNTHIIKEKIQAYKADFKADIITSRALMRVRDLMRICLHLSGEDTIFALYKGSGAHDEMQGLQNYQIFEKGLRKYCVFKASMQNSTEG